MGWPGGQLLVRLWETLSEKGIGSLLKPWQIKREGIAHIEVRRREILALAQAKRDAEDIRAGRKNLEDFSSKRKLGPRRIEPTINLQAIVEASARRKIEDSVRREVNVVKAIVHAEDSLKDDTQEPPKKKIDEDWLYRWRDYAGDVSVEQMQRLWGRLLAGELKAPGSYSLRCLDFLRNLSEGEAREIEHLSRFVVENLIWRADNDLLASEGVTYSFLLAMQDLGVVSGVEANGISNTWKPTGQDRFAKVLRSNGKLLIVKHDDPEKELTLESYLVTSIGCQVLHLGKFQPHIEYLQQVGRTILAQGFSVALADYVQVSDDKVQVFNEVPIQAQSVAGGARLPSPQLDPNGVSLESTQQDH